jgi:DNA-binding GntR family transcriptional regulator
MEIRRRILDNEMPPNAQFLEQELADALAMSRTPVREALIRLSEERLVEVRPRHGARVLPVSIEDMREIYELLTELEAMAARLLAERGLSWEQLARLEQAVADMEAALARDDLIDWARNDEIFHGLLVDLAGNSRLSQIVGMFRDQAHRARMQTLRLRPKPTASNRDHAAVVDAIRRRDGAAAAAIHRRHRQQAGAMQLALLAERGGDGL